MPTGPRRRHYTVGYTDKSALQYDTCSIFLLSKPHAWPNHITWSSVRHALRGETISGDLKRTHFCLDLVRVLRQRLKYAVLLSPQGVVRSPQPLRASFSPVRRHRIQATGHKKKIKNRIKYGRRHLPVTFAASTARGHLYINPALRGSCHHTQRNSQARRQVQYIRVGTSFRTDRKRCKIILCTDS